MNKNDRDKAEIKILGEKYTIKGNEPGDYILELGNFVDGQLKKIKEHNPSVSRTRLMVLGMMNLADKLYKTQNENENLKKDNNKKDSKYNELLSKYDELKVKYQELEEEYNEFLELIEEGSFD